MSQGEGVEKTVGPTSSLLHSGLWPFRRVHGANTHWASWNLWKHRMRNSGGWSHVSGLHRDCFYFFFSSMTMSVSVSGAKSFRRISSRPRSSCDLHVHSGWSILKPRDAKSGKETSLLQISLNFYPVSKKKFYRVSGFYSRGSKQGISIAKYINLCH